MTRATIIVHKGMRTGGTAFVNALAALPAYRVLMDPIHPAMRDFATNRAMTSSDWASHHPPGIRYWSGYDDLTPDGVLPGWEDRFADLRAMRPQDSDPGLERYLKRLDAGVRATGAVPIFAFEEAEGFWDELRRIFPEARHLCVSREPEPQFESWLTQLSYGNAYFFLRGTEVARALGWTPESPLALAQPLALEENELQTIFNAYRDRVTAIHHRRAEACIDVTKVAADLDGPDESRFLRALAGVGLTKDETQVVLSTVRSTKGHVDARRSVRQRLAALRTLESERARLVASLSRAEEGLVEMQRLHRQLTNAQAATSALLDAVVGERRALEASMRSILSLRLVRVALKVSLFAQALYAKMRPRAPQSSHSPSDRQPEQ